MQKLPETLDELKQLKGIDRIEAKNEIDRLNFQRVQEYRKKRKYNYDLIYQSKKKIRRLEDENAINKRLQDS